MATTATTNVYKSEPIGCLPSISAQATLSYVHKIPATQTTAIIQNWYQTYSKSKDNVDHIATQQEGQIILYEMLSVDDSNKLRHFHNSTQVTGIIVTRPKVPYITEVQANGQIKVPLQGVADVNGNHSYSAAWSLIGDNIQYLFAVEDPQDSGTKYSLQYVEHAPDKNGYAITPSIGSININWDEKIGIVLTSGHELANGRIIVRLTASNRAGSAFYQLTFGHLTQN
jgi:hypothetical protein